MPTYSSVAIGGVSSQFYLASLIGYRILESGGNAFDAAIAVSSALTLLLPYTSSIGGDGFLLARTSDGEIIAYNGSGRSPASFPVEEYLREKPVRGPLTVTVPGLVDLWDWVWENYASKPIYELLKKTIALAENGFYVHEQLANTIEKYRGELSSITSWNKVFAHLSKGDKVGFRELAWILKIMATRGYREFYEGVIAEELVEALNREGVPISTNDFKQHRGEKITPIKTRYKNYELYELPPNTQGITTLQLVKLIELSGLNKKPFNDPDRIMEFFKLAIIAYADRDRYVADPEYMGIDYNKLVDEKYLLKKLNMHKKQLDNILGGGDTTFFTVADKYGNIVGFIQSIFYPFGSGITVYGIPFQNRGAGFAASKNHPNSPAPGKRPLHTLSILYANNEGEEYMIGCAGGHLRPQIHSEILVNIADYKMPLSRAVEAPRYMLLEWRDERIVKAVVEEDLRAKPEVPGISFIESKSPTTGIVHALGVYKNKYYELVADPRGGGAALGLQS